MRTEVEAEKSISMGRTYPFDRISCFSCPELAFCNSTRHMSHVTTADNHVKKDVCVQEAVSRALSDQLIIGSGFKWREVGLVEPKHAGVLRNCRVEEAAVACEHLTGRKGSYTQHGPVSQSTSGAALTSVNVLPGQRTNRVRFEETEAS